MSSSRRDAPPGGPILTRDGSLEEGEVRFGQDENMEDQQQNHQQDERHEVDAEKSSPSPIPLQAVPERFDSPICVICLQDCHHNEPIWSCDTCYMILHKACMDLWVGESMLNDRIIRCPGCQQSFGHDVEQVQFTYRCWCRKVNWDFDDARPFYNADGVIENHSCGQVCDRLRPSNCPHRCLAQCHPGRCPPCQIVRSNVACVGGHQVFAPFLCGTDPPICQETCDAPLPCGHFCQSKCHSGGHQPCQVPISKTCACGAAVASITVPCSQLIVQCDTICTKYRRCQQHRCGRRCHVGDCEERILASAWSKREWVKIGPTSPAVAAPIVPWNNVKIAAPILESDDFPALTSSSSVSPTPTSLSRQVSSSSSSSASSASSSTGFESCGNICARIRPCGHGCSAKCHPPSKEMEVRPNNDAYPHDDRDDCKEDDTITSLRFSTTACSAFPCSHLVPVSCRCARKSAKLRCSEAQSERVRTQYQCDETCRLVKNGRRFFQLLETVDHTDDDDDVPSMVSKLLSSSSSSSSSSVRPSLRLLPFTRSMLSTLAHVDSPDGQFIRRLEAQMENFVNKLANLNNHNNNANNTSNGLKNMKPSSSSLSSFSYLYVTTSTPARSLIVQQMSLWYNLQFASKEGYIARITSPHHNNNSLSSNGVNRSKAQVTASSSSSSSSRNNLNAITADTDSDDDHDDYKSAPHPSPASSMAPIRPSLLASSAATYLTSTSICADQWPPHLLLKLQFHHDVHNIDSDMDERVDLLRRWFQPWSLESRIILMTTQLIHVLFVSHDTTYQAYQHLITHHHSELADHDVDVIPPVLSSEYRHHDETVRSMLKRDVEDHRRQTDAQYAILQAKKAEQQRAKHRQQASLHELAVGSSSITLIPDWVGHAKMKIHSTNIFALLDPDRRRRKKSEE